MNPEKPETLDESSLEQSTTVVESSDLSAELSQSPASSSSESLSGPSVVQSPSDTPPNKPKRNLPNTRSIFRRFNIYLLLFGAVAAVAIVVTGLALYANGKSNAKPTVATQALTSTTLKQLANSDATIGDPKQVLNVQSNAVFAGKVLIRDSLEVAGPIQVGGSVSLAGITVSGNSSFDQVQIRNTLSVGGNASLQGQLAVQKSLSVAGGATFGGAVTAAQINTSNLQINGDLVLTHHIVAGGPTPSRSNGSALGSGGTSSVSGSDTTGTINVNTGNGASAGCFATVTFTQKFNNVPHIMITPIGSAAGGMAYYVDRTTSSFSVCTAVAAPSNQSFAFDYFVVD